MIQKIITGEALEELQKLPDCSIDCCVTSPPYYGLRDYGVAGQIGMEQSPEDYIKRLVKVFDEVRRVLKNDGSLWLNIADSYCGTQSKGNYRDPKYPNGRNGQSKSITKQVVGCKRKDLIGIPWLLAFALRANGWYLRQDIIWHKPNAMPESVKDRCTRSHEYIFLLSKSDKYYFNNEAIKEPSVTGDRTPPRGTQGTLTANAGERKQDALHLQRYEGFNSRYFSKGMLSVRNKRDVWSVSTRGYKGAHFATFPESLIVPCILAGCKEQGIVLDPFLGSGTTAVVAAKNNRNFVGIELNPDYAKMAEKRIKNYLK